MEPPKYVASGLSSRISSELFAGKWGSLRIGICGQ
jgi:hypothetical protein